MITRGSKFFYGAGAFGLLSALLYGFLTEGAGQGGVIAVVSGDGGVVEAILGPLTLGWKGGVGEHVGYVVLMGFAGTMFMLGGLATAFRDADAEALAALGGIGVAELPEPAVPQGASLWPLVTALSAGVLAVGLAFSELLAWAGLAGLVVAGIEWTVRAWSERISADARANAAYRDQIMRPLEIPIGSVVLIAVVGLAISRVLLAISKQEAVWLIIIVAAIVFGTAYLLSTRPELTRTVVLALVLLAGLVVIGAGIVAGIAGPREIEPHGGEGEEGAAVLVGPAPAMPGDLLAGGN
jgi:hypothetical protein